MSHSRRSAIAAMTLAVAALLVGACASWGRQPDSGVRGRALYGPTCPAERVGQTCTRPYQTTIVIRSEPAGRPVTRTRSSANGYFSVNLFPGRYLLVPSAGRPYPRSRPQAIVVRRHRFTYVTITYDSGIR